MHGHKIRIRIVSSHPGHKGTHFIDVISQPRGVNVNGHGGFVAVVRHIKEALQKLKRVTHTCCTIAGIHCVGWVGVRISLQHPNGHLVQPSIAFIGVAQIAGDPGAILRDTVIHGIRPQALSSRGGRRHGPVLVDAGIVQEIVF